MMSLNDKIQIEYNFLYAVGFVNESLIDNGELFSSLNYVDHESGLVFNFTVEKGITSVSVSTIDILSSKKYSKFNKFYDFLYVAKLLYPEKNFSELNTFL